MFLLWLSGQLYSFMSSPAPSKFSFTIRRPTPESRATSSGSEDSDFKVPALPKRLLGANGGGSPLARSAAPSPKPIPRTYSERDSSDEEDEQEDELVTGFDQFGVQRLREKKKEPEGPLIIPALKNKDWRELARKRKQLYVPPSAAAQTGADGSVGGLGTRDTINSGPQLSGLQVAKRAKLEESNSVAVKTEEADVTATVVDGHVPDDVKKEEETEDQKALRALLASAQSDDSMGGDGAFITAIPAPSEDDAYRQDVEELPEPATLDDYERVPVSQFGAALLRGMGWTPGTAASKKQKGPIDPYLPEARPALLGIGAKEKEVFDDGSAGKGRKGPKGRPERKYVPVIKRERRPEDGDGERSGSREEERDRDRSRRRSPTPEKRSSRRPSRSPSSDRRRDRARVGRDAHFERDRDRRRDDRRDDDYSRKNRERDRDGDRRRDRSRDRYDSDRRRDKDRRY